VYTPQSHTRAYYIYQNTDRPGGRLINEIDVRKIGWWMSGDD
jgi:hypothetical protein